MLVRKIQTHSDIKYVYLTEKFTTILQRYMGSNRIWFCFSLEIIDTSEIEIYVQTYQYKFSNHIQ